MKKLLAVAVILLFFGVAVAPSINAVDRNKTRIFRDIPQGKMLRIPVMECKADGTRRQTTVSISRESAKELREKIRQMNTPGEKFLLFQQYGLIPKDVTLEQLRAEMYKFAERYDITLDKLLGLKERLGRITEGGKQSAVNFLSLIEGYGYYFGFNLMLGLSIIVGYINFLLWYKPEPPTLGIPSVDLFDIFLVVEGEVETTSNFAHFKATGATSLFLLGFVGYVFTVPFFTTFWFIFGFSIVTFVRAPHINYIEP